MKGVVVDQLFYNDERTQHTDDLEQHAGCEDGNKQPHFALHKQELSIPEPAPDPKR
jgi:hypothetical protein